MTHVIVDGQLLMRDRELLTLDEERILLMVFRSMVDTLVEELHEAMEAVMWRGQAT